MTGLEQALSDLQRAVGILSRDGDPGAVSEGVTLLQATTAQVLGAAQRGRLRGVIRSNEGKPRG